MKTLFFLILLIPHICLAQVVNIESDRGEAKQGVHGSSELGISLQKGNVQVFQTQASLRLDYIKGLHHSLFIGSLAHGQEDGKTFQNESYGHLRWTAMWWGKRTVGTEVFTQTQNDEFRLLQVRQLTGGGLRFTFFEDHLAIGLGAMSDYEEIDGVSKGTHALRGTSYIRVGGEMKDRIKGQIIGYYQPVFTSPSDFRVLTTGSLEFKVDKIFSLINELNYSYDTRPPEQVVKEDLSLRVKFKIKW